MKPTQKPGRSLMRGSFCIFSKKRTVQFLAIFLSLLSVSMPISLAATRTINLEYDDSGNLLSSVNQKYEYDEFNQLTRVKDSSGRVLEEYTYDDQGNRIKKVTHNPDGTTITTYYPDQDFVRVVDNSGTKDSVYYHDGLTLLAVKDSSGEMSYYHQDVLGSTTLVTDDSGNTIERTNYAPYGAVLEGGKSRYLYTGKELDSSELYYYGARYYDPAIMHFTQADTVTGDVYDPLQLNRYSYARNNPYKYTDPNGNIIQAVFGGLIGGVIGAGFDVIMQIAHGRSIFEGTIDWGSVGKSFGIGFVGGFVFTATLGLATPLLVEGLTGGAALGGSMAASSTAGIASGVSAQAVSNLLNDRPVTEHLAEAGLYGGVGGGIGGAVTGLRLPATRTPEYMPGTSRSYFNTGDSKFMALKAYSGKNPSGPWFHTETDFEGLSYTLAKPPKTVAGQIFGTKPYTRTTTAFIPENTVIEESVGYHGAGQYRVIGDLSKIVYLQGRTLP